MFYRKYKPNKILEKFVECYFVWEGDASQPIDIESPPSALCSLVFNYRDTYRISNQKFQEHRVPSCFISGQDLGNYTLHLSGTIGIIGCVFRPTAIHHFFGVPMYELTNERICFSEICSESYNSLKNIIQNSDNTAERLKILEKYLLNVHEKSQYGVQEIMESANEIFNKKGRIRLLDILEKVPMSRRNFERKFLEEVGVSPKTYAKIRRFSYTCSLMSGKRDVNLMDVLFEGGYYDQSHFIKDFKFFSGRTPRKYAKTNVELANFIGGITIVERRLQE